MAWTLRTKNEVRDAGDYFDAIPDAKADKNMLAIAEKIIEQQEGDFDPSTFNDRYEDALKALIAEKTKGQKLTEAPAPTDTNVVDLMEALRASLQKGGASKTPPSKTADKATPIKAATGKASSNKADAAKAAKPKAAATKAAATKPPAKAPAKRKAG